MLCCNIHFYNNFFRFFFLFIYTISPIFQTLFLKITMLHEAAVIIKRNPNAIMIYRLMNHHFPDCLVIIANPFCLSIVIIDLKSYLIDLCLIILLLIDLRLIILLLIDLCLIILLLIELCLIILLLICWMNFNCRQRLFSK